MFLRLIFSCLILLPKLHTIDSQTTNTTEGALSILGTINPNQNLLNICNENNATPLWNNSTAYQFTSTVYMSSETDIKSSDVNKLQTETNFNVTQIYYNRCNKLSDLSNYTQTQIIDTLTANCRYDRLERPPTLVNGTVTNDPTEVFINAYVNSIESTDSDNLQFTMFATLYIMYNDTRLCFEELTTDPSDYITGSTELYTRIWVPSITLRNQKDSNILSGLDNNIRIIITPSGTVILATNVLVTLFCSTTWGKFPYDVENCTAVFQSWMYNTNQLILHWQQNQTIIYSDQMKLLDYTLMSTATTEGLIAQNPVSSFYTSFSSNYSTLQFTIQISQSLGYYFLDYFLPSIIIVAIGWTSCWLRADQTPARTMLGTSTLLTFITLTSSMQSSQLKTKYLSLFEIWFVVCTLFIVSGLVEFAFSNTVFRRRRNLELKRLKSKYILKSTLTHRKNRCQSEKHITTSQYNSSEPTVKVLKCMSLEMPSNISESESNLNYYTTQTSNSTISIEDNAVNNINLDPELCCGEEISNDKESNNENSLGDNDSLESLDNKPWAQMTPEEASAWLDRRARFLLPISFLLFNAIFWLVVFCV
ncbi:pH-sensitive chloride channel 2-like [Teleopsis dalmanni]|uniref:pH-sensitive chloride channel 2-like n=1 Tax=Teleopsis dalmanni TaxID=139649 RepID=UPI0018CCD879|nr:pH-sensitive chloride channel 2-like [Teleopsis dalmanni]